MTTRTKLARALRTDDETAEAILWLFGSAQGMQLREDPRSGAEAEGLQPGPDRDAPNHDITRKETGSGQ